MAEYPYHADIEVSLLRLDLRNPRFPGSPDSQREAFAQMAEEQGDKLLNLCRHIATHGLNPAQQFIVLEDDDNQFVVLDANRRLTAIRVLEQPNLIERQITSAALRQLKHWADTHKPPDDVPCVVFRRREDADTWIELFHEGEAEGAGLVPWSSQQKARHRSREGTKAPHLQILDFVRNDGDEGLSQNTVLRIDQGNYPISTLERVLTTPHVRTQLGIEITDGKAQTKFPKDEVLKGLTKLVDDIGSRKVTVRRFMTSDDRKSYIDGFSDEQLPDPNTQGTTLVPLDDAPDRPPTESRSRDRRPSTSRRTLIPSNFTIQISSDRLNDIYLELKRKLKVGETPNAAGVLLRVFLELSADIYIGHANVSMPRRPTLGNKITAIADFMEVQGTMSTDELIPVREAVKSPDRATLATNLNALIHNPNMTVSGNDLKALWGRLETFVEKLWE